MMRGRFCTYDREDCLAMNDRSLRSYLLASLALALAPSGCGVILGLDDFTEGLEPAAAGEQGEPAE